MCTCKLMVTSYRLSSFFCLAKNIGIRISYNESYLSIGLVCQSPSLRANRFANDAYESLKVVRALRNKKVKNLLPAKISGAVDLAFSPKNVQRFSHLRMNRIIRCKRLKVPQPLSFVKRLDRVTLSTSTSSTPKKLWLEYEVKKPIAFEAKKVMTVLS